VLNLVRQSHGGKLYDSSYKSRFRGTGPHADLLRQRFKLALKRLGLNRRPWDFNTSLFKPPPQAGDQLSLL
jgi:DNA repair photolyase